MTREEALVKVREYLTDLLPIEDCGEVEEIMSALEQQPCEDCISRKAVLGLKTIAPIAPVINGEDVHYEEVIFVHDLEKLSSVEMEKCGDCISREAAIYAVGYYSVHSDDKLLFADKPLKDLPPVEPERKTGKWIRCEAYPHHIYCSECYKTFIPNDEMRAWVDGDLPRKYCPNCGAKMEV